VPVGFKYFVDGLLQGRLGFAGEESAGSSFARIDGTVWTTDKDGIVAALLAAEITAVCKKDPGQLYAELAGELGDSLYCRSEAPATSQQKKALENIGVKDIHVDVLAGEKPITVITNAPGDGNSIGGVKVTATSGWFAARPSGSGKDHLARIEADAQAIVNTVFTAADSSHAALQLQEAK